MTRSEGPTPVGLMVAGVVFVSVGIAELGKVMYVWILILVGLVLFFAGLAQFLHKLR